MGKDPTVQQLRAFQAVATELHFGRAAARLHSTQPPLTRHIQALEDALGVQLLRRNSRNARDQIAALHEGSIDCGLLRASANVDPWLEFEAVCTDVFVAALPSHHRLALGGAPEIDLADLATEPFIAYEGRIGQGMINAMLSGCAAAGFTPAVKHLVQSTLMLLALVASGEGVALVSSEIAKLPRDGVRFVGLRGQPAKSSILMASRRG